MRPRVLQTLRHILDFKREQWMDRDSLERLAQERYEDIVRSAWNTDYYSKIFKEHCQNPVTCGHDLSIRSKFYQNGFDLLDIPLTEKENVRDSHNDFVSWNAKDELKKIETSGSTGIPTKVFMDQRAFENTMALEYALSTEYGLSPSDLFAEIIYKPYTRHPIFNLLGLFRKQFLSIFDDESENLEKVRNSSADVLGWLPSVTNVMANLNKESDKPIRLKSVFSTGEFLSESVRKNIEDSFSCPVFNEYGGMEFGSFCFECPQEHNMHIINSSFLIEIVDGNGKPKKSGTGEIVVTSLINKAMPLIRYRMGDRASWGKECPCGRGFPTLKSLEGRKDDVIILPSGKIRSAFSINIMDFTFVLAYQIIQEKEDLFVFRYVPSKKGEERFEKEKITKFIRDGCLGEEIKVEFEEVDRINRGPSGKINSVMSKVKNR